MPGTGGRGPRTVLPAGSGHGALAGLVVDRDPPAGDAGDGAVAAVGRAPGGVSSLREAGAARDPEESLGAADERPYDALGGRPSLAGALCSRRADEHEPREQRAASAARGGGARACRIRKIASASVARLVRRRGSLSGRPSPAVCSDSFPRRASTIVPTGSAAMPFSGTKPGSALTCCVLRAVAGSLT